MENAEAHLQGSEDQLVTRSAEVRWKVHNQSVWGVAGDDVEVRCGKEGGFSSEGEKGEPKHTPKAEETLTAMEAHKRVHPWVTLGLCLNTMNLVRVRKQVLSIGPMKQPCATVVVRQRASANLFNGHKRERNTSPSMEDNFNTPLHVCRREGIVGEGETSARPRLRKEGNPDDPWEVGNDPGVGVVAQHPVQQRQYSSESVFWFLFYGFAGRCGVPQVGVWFMQLSSFFDSQWKGLFQALPVALFCGAYIYVKGDLKILDVLV
ncbi:hypothetical protein ACSQ67_016519 [Phaseolus vulgaris]